MMSVHTCQHPCWHRTLIFFGTWGYFYGTGLGIAWAPWMPNRWLLAATVLFLVSTWVVKHLLQWRCQGSVYRHGHRRKSLVWLMLGLWFLGRQDS